MKQGGTRSFEWLPTVLAAAAFAIFAGAFVYELIAFQRKVVSWATGDINSRAHLAAANLVEPLKTQDFAAIQQIGASCEADGLHLLVMSDRGGVVFDSRGQVPREPLLVSDRCASGEYLVSVGIPQARVLEPFKRAVRGFLLAGLVGVAGVLLFFFVTYRQRVRIRELAKVEAFRRTFVADVSHEIKTPLTGILGAADLMDEANPLVPLIKKEAKRLNQLVQSILDLARLEREGEVLHLVETDLGELVRELAARYGCGCEAVSPCVVSCDAQLVAQAVENLLTNAKRHAGTEDITVSVRRADRRASIVVEDHGVGIPPEHAARIFERFHRVDPARAAETGGAGLGLAIVRRIARLHGGDVAYEPAVPHGSRFVLTLLMRP